MKRKIIISILIIILIGFGVLACLFVNSIKEDQAITKEKADEIVSAYEKFNSSIMAFAALREEYYNNRENTFLEEFASKVDEWNTFIEKYENMAKEIHKNSKTLKKDCTVKFADVNVNSKCTNFKANYEAAMNYYIADIEGYNKTVKQYNDWVTENGYSYAKLNEGKLVVYKDYIDFDKDGEYFGKEVKASE